MKKAINLLVALFLVMGFASPVSAQIDSSGNFSTLDTKGPKDGEFSTWVKRLYDGQNVKFYIKYPQPNSKVEILINGKERSYFRLGDKNLDASGNYSNLQNEIYFIRTLELDEGKNRIQLRVDGEVVKTAIYTKSDEPISAPPAPTPAITLELPEVLSKSSGIVKVEATNVPQEWKYQKYCIEIDGQASTSAQVINLLFGASSSVPSAGGCYSPSSVSLGQNFSFALATSGMQDGTHSIRVTGHLAKQDESAVELSVTKNFKTDNFSLKATAPAMSIYGSNIAGQKLTVNSGYWGTEVSLSYQWLSGDERVRGATASTYLLTGADVGKQVSVEVTASRQGEDSVTFSVDATGVTGAQPAASASSYSASTSTTQYQVVETDYSDEEIANYVISIRHPNQLLCTSSYCTLNATATWAGTLSTYTSVGASVYLKNAAGQQVSSSYLYLYSNGSQVDDLSFSIPYTQAVGSQASYTIEIDPNSWSSREAATPISTGITTVIRGPNTANHRYLSPNFDSAVLSSGNERLVQGSTSSPTWVLWNFAYPTSMKVMSSCMPVEIYAAPISLASGLADGTANTFADVTVRITNRYGTNLESLSVIGSSGGWNQVGTSYLLQTKVCGLSTKQGVNDNLTISLSFNYDNFDLGQTNSISRNLAVQGGLKWTSINCYKGTAGQTITEYKPSCPDGWTQTTAKIIGNKVQMTTLNCLKGTSVKVVTAPEPKCPSGYEVTKLAVKNGKLVPWTITCTKGVLVKKVTGVFPSCPSGYTKR